MMKIVLQRMLQNDGYSLQCPNVGSSKVVAGETTITADFL